MKKLFGCFLELYRQFNVLHLNKSKMNRKIFKGLFVSLLFAGSLAAFCYLNTTGKNEVINTFNARNAQHLKNDPKLNTKINTASDSSYTQINSSKNTAAQVQNIEIMKLIIHIGLESLPVLTIRDFIPILRY